MRSGMEEIQILLKIFKGDLIATFELAVFSGLLLNGVICEMDVFVAAVLQRKFEAGSAEIAPRVEISGYHGCGSDQHEAADIEFASVEKVGRDVSLDDEGAIGMFYQTLLYVLPHLFSSLADLNSAPTI